MDAFYSLVEEHVAKIVDCNKNKCSEYSNYFFESFSDAMA